MQVTFYQLLKEIETVFMEPVDGENEHIIFDQVYFTTSPREIRQSAKKLLSEIHKKNRTKKFGWQNEYLKINDFGDFYQDLVSAFIPTLEEDKSHYVKRGFIVPKPDTEVALVVACILEGFFDTSYPDQEEKFGGFEEYIVFEIRLFQAIGLLTKDPDEPKLTSLFFELVQFFTLEDFGVLESVLKHEVIELLPAHEAVFLRNSLNKRNLLY